MRAPRKPAIKKRSRLPDVPEVPEVTGEAPASPQPGPPEADDDAIRRMLEAAYT